MNETEKPRNPLAGLQTIVMFAGSLGTILTVIYYLGFHKVAVGGGIAVGGLTITFTIMWWIGVMAHGAVPEEKNNNTKWRSGEIDG